MTEIRSPLFIHFPDALLEELVATVLERTNGRQRFLSKRALADHYGVSERTIKTWREKGLPARKVGRALMFCVEETDRWIDCEGRGTPFPGTDR